VLKMVSSEEIVKGYVDAQNGRSKRGDFLDQFFKDNPSKSVSKLVYDEDQKEVRKYLGEKVKSGEISEENLLELLDSINNQEDELDMLAFCLRGPMGLNRRSIIFIMSHCFRLGFEDFISTIVDHEYIHAKHVEKGIIFRKGLEYNNLVASSFDPDVLLDLDESIAYCNTIEIAFSKKHNSKFIGDCKDTLKKITNKLKELNDFISTSEKSTVEFQIVKNEEVLSFSF
jgi:hypothetical protein